MASASLGTLTIDLVARIGGFVEGLSKAERESKKFRSKVEKDLKDFGKTVAGFAIAGAAATVALVKSSIDNADALLAQSQMYGVNIELLSGYQLGLEKAESSSADLATGLKGLANAVDSNSEAFARLQISTRNSDGSLKDSNTLLEEIADRFASMPDGITKTALAQDLLGKSGIKLIPFLNEGAAGLRSMREESEKLGKVITLETAQAADRFNDNLATLKAVITGTGNELAKSLLPKMIEFTDTVNDPATQQGIKDIVNGLAQMAIQLTKIVTLIPNVTRFLAEEFASLMGGPALDDAARLNELLAETENRISVIRNFGGGARGLQSELPGLEAQAQQLKEMIALNTELAEAQKLARASSPAASPTAANAPTFNPLIAGGSDAADAAEKRLAQYRQELALLGQTGEASKLRYDLEEGALKGLINTNKELADQLLLNAEAIDTEAWFAEYQKKREAGEQEQANLQKQIDLYGETSSAVIYRYEVEKGLRQGATAAEIAANEALYEQLDLKKQLAEEAANDEQFAVMEAGLQKQIDLLGETSDAAILLYDIEHGGYKQFDEDQQAKLVLLAEELEAREAMMREIEEQEKAKAKIMEEFAERTQNILADFLKGSFDDGLKGAADRFKQMLADLAAEAVAADIMKFVVGLGKNSGGTGGGWGQAISAFAGFFDSGGMIPAGQWGIAGENGAEIIRGPANITSTKDTAAMLGKGGATNNITFNFPGVTNKQEAQQAAGVAHRQWNRMDQVSRRHG